MKGLYIPKAFEQNDENKLYQFIRENSFGILFSQTENGPFATHLPFIVEEGRLVSHFAKANPHWRSLDGSDVLVIFHGPHVYISPTWYEDDKTVPTWNYTAVHVSGKVSIVEDKKSLQESLAKLIYVNEQFEENPWATQFDLPYIERLMKGIVGVVIEIQEIEGKWKLNQHHPLERQKNTIKGLQKSNQLYAKHIASLMESNISKVEEKEET